MSIEKNKYFINTQTLIVISGFLLSLTGCDKSDSTSTAKPPSPSVVVKMVKQENIPVYMNVPGTVKPVKNVKIVPRVSGYIFERKFTEGTPVSKGDLLYKIDPRPFQAKLDSLYAQLKQHQANLKFWTSEVARYTQLIKKGFVSVEEKEKFTTKQAVERATIVEYKAKINNAKLDLSFTQIFAPFNGHIQDTSSYVGDLVNKHQTELTNIVQLDPIYVISNISREQVYQIQQLQQQGYAPKEWNKFNADLIMPDKSIYEFKGNLNFASTLISPSTDTLKVRFEFQNPKKGDKRSLILGQYIPLRMIVGHQPNTLLIPGKSLLQTQEGTFVFVINKDKKVEKRMVEIGDSYQQQWIIKKGLKLNEQVITEGLQKVRPGMEVTISSVMTDKKNDK